MDRRGWLASVAALVLGGAAVGSGRPTSQGREVLFFRHDDKPVTHLLYDRYCPAGQIHAIDGVAIASVDLCRRLPPQDSTVERYGATFGAWRLGRPTRDAVPSVLGLAPSQGTG